MCIHRKSDSPFPSFFLCVDCFFLILERLQVTAAFIGSFFSWIDLELVKNATKTLQKETVNVITSAPRGAFMGACLLFADCIVCARQLIETVDRFVLPSLAFIFGLAALALLVWSIQHVSGFWFIAWLEAKIAADGGGGGGGGPPPPPPFVPHDQSNKSASNKNGNSDEAAGAGSKARNRSCFAFQAQR